jgi:hypothetical protein
LPEGRYVVTWRSWDDSDGAIFGDCYTFFIGQAAADAAFNDRFRLDGGNTCQRIDVSARDGTPVAGGTPQGSVTPEDSDDHDDEESMTNTGDGEEDSDIPIWALAVGIIGGVVVGGVGGRFLASR